jgi:hypothetical protein
MDLRAVGVGAAVGAALADFAADAAGELRGQTVGPKSTMGVTTIGFENIIREILKKYLPILDPRKSRVCSRTCQLRKFPLFFWEDGYS